MPQNTSTLPILWFAFLVAHLAFAGVSYVAAPDVPVDPMVAAPFGAAVVGLLGVNAFASRLFGAMPVQSAWLVRFALAEAVGLTAMAGWFLGQPAPFGYAVTAIGIVAHLALFPTADRLTAWEIDRLGRSDGQ